MNFKKVRCILSSVLVFSAMSITAFADNTNTSGSIENGNSVVIDKGELDGDNILLPGIEIPIKKGSIKISLENTNSGYSKEGVKFSLSKVADVVNGEYKLLDEYKSARVDLNNLKNSNDLDLAANTLKKFVKTDKTLVTNANGECSIDNLDVGVYLLYASDISNYENITPFLVSISTWDNTSKTMSYDIEIIPKHTPLPVKEPSKNKAPSTGFNAGGVFGALSLASLTGAGILFVAKRKG
ncbi:hypothetical protein QJR26_04355 [Clostridium baratii]